MPVLTLLTPEEQFEFETPPTLSGEQRRTFFTLSDIAKKTIHRLQGETNKVCFLVQMAYFKSCQQFFDATQFKSNDLVYAARVLGLDDTHLNIDIQRYRASKTMLNHQRRILQLLDYRPYEQEVKSWLRVETNRLVAQQIQPKKIFILLLNMLQERRIVFPTYHALSKLISDVYLTHEKRLVATVKQCLSKAVIAKLDTLLITDDTTRQTAIRLFKVVNQSMKPKEIQYSLSTFIKIKSYFDQLDEVLQQLSLHKNCVQYYATWVRKAKLSQLRQFPNRYNLYLHLVAFIKHQVYIRHDYFVDILLKSVQSAKNIAQQKVLHAERLSRKERRQAIKKMVGVQHKKDDLIQAITEITQLTVLNADTKLEKINQLLINYYALTSEAQSLQIDDSLLTDFVQNTGFYDAMESGSIRLQNRVSGIIKILMFNELNSDPNIYSAVQYFVEKDGKCDQHAPIDFLSEEEKSMLFSDKNKFRPSLYKALLFQYIADAIKSGKLNLKHSYRYQSIYDYLIPDQQWSKDRDHLLKTANLSDFKDVEVLLKDYKHKLSNLYDRVNQRYQKGLNPYLKLNEQNKIIIHTPSSQQEKKSEYMSKLLCQRGLIPIFQVLHDIEQATKMASCFEHHRYKDVKGSPNLATFFAGIIGLGCNIGIQKMGQVTLGVNSNTLTNTVNWYFSIKNLEKVNARIVQFIHRLALPEVFMDDPNTIHSSSDGHKVNVKVNSLVASLSFKYFGKDKGVSVYTFIDQKQALFHSLVMSASEREAAYVYDGLLNHEIDYSQVHSTDTHGYREGLFAVAPFANIGYAPRIKNIGAQRIYAFSHKRTYEKKGYKILPSNIINQRLIKEHWDDILRFMTTIKLGETTTSQLFKRLSSYAKHHPLYRAIKEFGRIIKSIFILKYYDDVVLRQRIEKQLNRIELSNKFSRAVFFANSGEFEQSEIEDQAIATICKVIIQNSVVLWNYLYLSQLLTNCTDEHEKKEIVGMISRSSVITWQHINLHGEYDFRQQAANESTFNIQKILSLSFEHPKR